MSLKDIAVGAFASETLANETWSDLVKYCVERVNVAKLTFEAVCAELSDCEKQMKAEYDVSIMPPAWRSAKSVVLAALAEEIGLIDGAIVRGKTAVEKDIKEWRARREAASMTDADAALAIVSRARELLRTLIGHAGSGDARVRAALVEIEAICQTVRS